MLKPYVVDILKVELNLKSVPKRYLISGLLDFDYTIYLALRSTACVHKFVKNLIVRATGVTAVFLSVPFLFVRPVKSLIIQNVLQHRVHSCRKVSWKIIDGCRSWAISHDRW